jgi:hypothetical protein
MEWVLIIVGTGLWYSGLYIAVRYRKNRETMRRLNNR